MTDALSRYSTRATPQTDQADPRQVLNSEGGYTFTASTATRLDRFLTLGTEGGTYYAREPALTKSNAQLVTELARHDDPLLIDGAVGVSQAGRAPRNNPALFAIAAAAGLGSTPYRARALEALPLVARTGSHLLTFAGYAEQFRGWGPQLTKAIGAWYNSKDLPELVFQVLKYKQRDGWSQRDLMRLAHFGRVPVTGPRRALYNWVLKDDTDNIGELAGLAPVLTASIAAHATRNVRDWERIIAGNRSLSWEMLPSQAHTYPEVWRAMIENGNLPLGATIRKLGQISATNAFRPLDTLTAAVAGQVTDPGRLARARVHPISVLVALRTYASGHGARGKGTWTPVPELVDALDAGFYAAFGAVEPSGKRIVNGVDVSASMAAAVSGLPLTCREAAAAMAMVTAHTEPSCATMAFAHRFMDLGITSRMRLDDAIRLAYRSDFGGTDCALPMLWALENGVEADTFRVMTDHETGLGRIHPHQALQLYREKTGINATLAVVAFTATEFSIAAPDDPGMLDVSGFDANVPTLLADFARGDL